ncbi:fimbrial protein [Erwinia sp. E602]|uniref:fimbrial protein n=1 Tax=unclassified Erwinia TaxID=2622719 RepID=UPI000B1F4039|nr:MULTISPECIES: fimbrial protein [unclassified Erwinia]QUG73942.1 fimbrial protein [Erwinia sp. E602]
MIIAQSRKLISAQYMAAVIVMALSANAAEAVPARPPGMPDGGCWADPMNILSITLGTASFTSNQPGSTGSVAFHTIPENYPGWCYSEHGENGAHYFKSEVSSPPSNLSSEYYRLNEDIDYNIKIDLYNTKNISSPFTDIYDSSAKAGPGANGVTALGRALVGNAGTVNFRLRRTILGGALFFPGGIELANLYRYVYKGSPATIPIYRLVTQQTVIPVPVECRINGGQTILVPFGNIDSSLVSTSAAGSVYRAERALTYKCNTTLTQDIKVSLAAEPAGFSDAIKTSNPDIGVVMQYQNLTVTPNDGFKTRLVNGQGSDSVTFAVVGSGKTPATGPFTGSATLIITNL